MKGSKLLLALRNLSVSAVLAGACVVLLAGALLVADCLLFPRLARPNALNYNRGQNGLWLGSKWYQGKAAEAEVEQIGELLNKEQVAFGYFHCRDINSKGELRYHCRDSGRVFVRRLKKICPQVKLIAWIGAVNVSVGGEVNVRNEAVRHKMAQEAAWLVNECGFDGVQWDYERCDDGDTGVLDLLKLTRAELGPEALVGICAPRFWSETYTGDVSRLCDQIALMDYDTGVWLPRLYAWMVSNDVVRFTRAITNERCAFIEGVPTYEEPTAWHHPLAENLAIALLGVKDGLANKQCKRDAFAGVAPYAEFTTDSKEWAQYEHWWLGRPD